MTESNENVAVKLVGYFLIGSVIYFLLNGFSLRLDIDNLMKSAFIDIVVYALLEFTFDRWLWKIKVIKVILRIKTPYIHGRWKGYIKSSYDDFKTKIPIVIEIHQRYKSTKLLYYDKRAISHGLITVFAIEEGSPPKLFCIYHNEPIIAFKKELQMHYGTMILTLHNNETKMSGVYFNFPLQRSTYGELYAELKDRKLRHCFEE
ncbi:MAG: hypothetical protein QXN36_00095 [Candidatus Bathyarchaeia archaeon]